MTTFLFTRHKITLTVAFLLGAFQMINAQTSITAFGSAGISDIEVSGLGILDVVDPYIKPVTQYTTGFQYERGFNSNFSFVTGAQYTSRGFSVKEDFNIGVFGIDVPIGARLDTRLHYLEVPAMLKYTFGESGVTPYVKAGVSTAYAINGKIIPKVNAIITWKLPAINIKRSPA